MLMPYPQISTQMSYKATPITQVIIAAWNEEEGIGLTIAEMQNYLSAAKIVVVDGNSTDKTAEAAKELGATVILPRW